MTAIYLIRHGQAAPNLDDYDHLSDKGFAQAKILGSYWRNLPHPHPDRVFCGDMLRHRQTLAGFSEGYDKGHFSPSILPGLNEFDHVDVLNQQCPQWVSLQHSDALMVQFKAAFQRWQSGEYDHQYQESWTEYKRRCTQALNTLIQQSEAAKNLLVFSSGGTITALLQSIAQWPDHQFGPINRQIRNTSVTRLFVHQSNVHIDYINNFSHLEQAGGEWITFR